MRCRQVGSEYTFTIRDPSTVTGIAFGVSYDAFIDDVQARTDPHPLDCAMQPSFPLLFV